MAARSARVAREVLHDGRLGYFRSGRAGRNPSRHKPQREWLTRFLERGTCARICLRIDRDWMVVNTSMSYVGVRYRSQNVVWFNPLRTEIVAHPVNEQGSTSDVEELKVLLHGGDVGVQNADGEDAVEYLESRIRERLLAIERDRLTGSA